ncbi:hypothetical protein RXV86_01490 [Alisedimentitalea sp. MJ-SS2]|uniref:hypothetical protein n=1 Tax=Aliisedimentitalea sp. MJ-SS2 TaxID=3049795 RepID=UPI0029074A8E|nr:hypothetical protein [Alisedimentitalea sp. MJ-SS2]MDU8926049.1 hypothetical protein [Alisedimentitalea sp. MJ-SS2]
MSHGTGGEYRHERNTKAQKAQQGVRGKMHGQKRHGLDYTPLYRFLQSRVGEDWDGVHAEAVARLDRQDPIWHLVARRKEDRKPLVRVGESTYFSGLFVDGDNRLQRVDPTLNIEDLEPTCGCCTHTFNGQPYVRKFSES